MEQFVIMTVTGDESSGESGDVHCDCKVGRGIDDYGLSPLNEELVQRWQGDGRDRASLRELATVYNQRILAAALDRAGASRIDGEVANFYRLLTGDDVSTGIRTQTRRQLKSEGVPIETVEDQFVSHQSIHTHLTDCLDVSRDDDPTEPAERRRADRDRIRALQRRTEVVTTDALDRLRGADALELGEFDAFVDVSILCADCNTQYDIGKLLDEGGCSCQSSSARE